MRSLWVVIATLFVACVIITLPGELRGQEACQPEEECVGCEIDEYLGEWHHFTSGYEFLDVCVSKTQDGHDTQSGCTFEPHEKLCLYMCVESHEYCDPGEEDLANLVEAVEASDTERVQAMMALQEPAILWNPHRSALQVLSKCSGQVVFHVPVRRTLADWLGSF